MNEERLEQIIRTKATEMGLAIKSVHKVVHNDKFAMQFKLKDHTFAAILITKWIGADPNQIVNDFEEAVRGK